MNKKVLLELANRAVDLSNNSPDDIKTGCVIYKTGRIIGEGWNQPPQFWRGSLVKNCGGTIAEMIHAEDAALDQVTRSYHSSKWCDVICTVSPCVRCSLRLIGAKVRSVGYIMEFWKPEAEHALDLLRQADIYIYQIKLEGQYVHS